MKTVNKTAQVYNSPDEYPTAFLLIYVVSMIALLSVATFGLSQAALGPLQELLATTDMQVEFRKVVNVVFDLTAGLLVALFYDRVTDGDKRAKTIFFSPHISLDKRGNAARPTIRFQIADVLKYPVIMAKIALDLIDLDTNEISTLRLKDPKFLLTPIPWTFVHILDCDSPLLLRPRPLQCSQCGEKFTNTEDLASHLKRFHDKTLFSDTTIRGNFKIVATLQAVEPLTGKAVIVRKTYEADSIKEGANFNSSVEWVKDKYFVELRHFLSQ